MKRLRLERNGSTSERWMVSYADLMTLLLAFFVVMYAVSTVNEGKYRVLSDTLKEAFSKKKSGIEVVSVKPVLGEFKKVIDPIPMLEHANDFSAPVSKLQRDIDVLYDTLSTNLEDALQDVALWKIERRRDGLAIEVNSDIVFVSGKAAIQDSFVGVIERIAEPTRERPFSIQVEGFTDDQPISTVIFPTNWELSGARGASLVRVFESFNIESNRLSFVGYGEHYPIASNENEAGRARNRRAVIVLRAINDFAAVDRKPDEAL